MVPKTGCLPALPEHKALKHKALSRSELQHPGPLDSARPTCSNHITALLVPATFPKLCPMIAGDPNPTTLYLMGSKQLAHSELGQEIPCG